MTAEQLEASRAERMRQNGHGAVTLEDARTWIEETGLCLFLPRRQFAASIAPSFVEAVAGQRDATPDPKFIAIAEELLVRLETDGVAVRLNLLGQPGDQPDFVVAGWVLPYVYALRGDRDWRRSPQLTGSRQVSPLAVQAYKILEAGDTNLSDLTHALGREVTESAVLRAITELWQQLRIIPSISAPGVPAEWQLLRQRFQKAIAEGASTSQVTAISVLASIYLQAVIAATMEDVEVFLAPLTARSKVREVLRGLMATRQVHTISLGHSPHFYVAGTLPEFPVAVSAYSSSSMSASAYFMRNQEDDEPEVEAPETVLTSLAASAAAEETVAPEAAPALRKATAKPAAARPHFSRPAAHSRDRKPAPAPSSSRPPRRSSSDSRPSGTGSASGPRPASGSRPASGTRWGANASGGANGSRPSGNGSQRNGHAGGKPVGKPSSATRTGSAPRKDGDARPAARNNGHKPSLTAGVKAGNSKQFGFTARPDQGTKKQG